MSQCVSRNFPGIFGIFGVFFVPCKHFLEFPNLFLRWKIFQKKHSFPIRMSPRAGPAPAPAQPGPLRPIGHRGRGLHGRRRRRPRHASPHLALGVRAYKGKRPSYARPSPHPRLRNRASAAGAAPVAALHHRGQPPPALTSTDSPRRRIYG
jgi:hypothetical protein